MSSFRLWIFRLLTAWLPESRGFGFKAALLRWCGAQVGSDVRIYSSARFLGVGGLRIADDVHIGPDAFFSLTAGADVVLGSRVDIAPGVMVLTGSHEIDRRPNEHAAGRGTAASVTIGDGCWLCARAIILPGVTVGEGAVVAAGAVVTCDVPPFSLVAGVPAKRVEGESTSPSR